MQSTALGTARDDEMVTAVPDGGGASATTRAVPPSEAVPELKPQPVADAASTVPITDDSTAAEPVPEAVPASAAVPAAATEAPAAAAGPPPVPTPAAGAEVVALTETAGPPPLVNLPAAVLSTDETLAPTSPVLVSPFAAIAAVPVRYSLEENRTLSKALDTPQVRATAINMVPKLWTVCCARRVVGVVTQAL